MRIGGLQPFSLSDFPGRVAAVVFTQGCNFRCPFCHNSDLIPPNPLNVKLIPQEEVIRFIRSRLCQLDGVVICGGEPTIQPDLAGFSRRIKVMGFDVKLDTNGSRPETIKGLLREGLVDYIAMDIKAPLDSYSRLAGVCPQLEKLEESIEVIARSGVEHEFRTTVVEKLLSKNDIQAIRAMVPPGSPHRLQKFNPENAFDHTLRDAGPSNLQEHFAAARHP